MTEPEHPDEAGARESARLGATDQAGRWRALLDALAVRRRLGVAEAAELLGVSPATVRRDFTELARRQLATRTHGGIVASAVSYDLPARYRTSADDPRERIAAEVADRIVAGLAGAGQTGEGAPGSVVVAFNGGTTTTAAARRLAERVSESSAAQRGGEVLTIVTNALNIGAEMVLRPAVRTVVIGGVARPESYELHGPFASRVLGDLLIDHLLLGVDALSAGEGASCHHLGEAGINAEMVARARRVTVLAAAPKIGRISLARICGTDAVDAVVTDIAADPAEVEALRAAGVEVTLV